MQMVRKILQNVLLKSKTELQEHWYILRGVMGWAGGERKALLSVFHSMSYLQR